ncbi:hypothetical protein SEA_NANOSMITE_106 [Mycobacterium phage Nanosmite]|nr:hypothetical protein SEA_NANOSMITE_106 [Mycobacterium phage Nanosmite]
MTDKLKAGRVDAAVANTVNSLIDRVAALEAILGGGASGALADVPEESEAPAEEKPAAKKTIRKPKAEPAPSAELSEAKLAAE